MMTITPFLWAAFALFVGALIAWLVREREVGPLRTAFAEEKTRAGELVTQLSRTEAELSTCRADLAAANERVAALAQIGDRMRGEFATLAQGALDAASRNFLELASARLGEERQAVAGNLATGVQEIKGVISPVQEEFAKFTAAVKTLQTDSSQNLGALKASLEQVVHLQAGLQEAVRTTNDATGQLRSALQNPRVAGNWGEMSLDRIVELAGMSDHVDFERQAGMHASDGSGVRPDLVVHLTCGLNIPVDAKAPTANYVKAAAESNELERQRLLKQSAADLRGRVSELRGRPYDKIPGFAGMTMLYVPNEAMLSSTLAQDPDVIEDALRSQIVVCSPLLLLCYLRAFAHGWRLQKQQQNAEEVARRGRTLHERLQSFFAAFGKVGSSLNQTVEKFNIVVGKMDNLLVPGRELGRLLSVNGDLEGVEPAGTLAREVRFTDGAGCNGGAMLPDGSV